MPTDHSERLLRLEGLLNLRDLGGYPTAEGSQTRWRRLLRSDNLDCLTEQGYQVLAEYGLSLVIDLRTDWEVTNYPYRLPADIGRHLPLYHDYSKPWLQNISNYIQFYRVVLEDCQPELRAIFEAIAESDPASAVLFHCASGKDRTGLIAAMLLELAGVPDALIAEDYSLSAGYLVPRIEVWRREALQQGKDMVRFESDVAADPRTMLATLAHLQEQYGGTAHYLIEKCNLPAAQVAQLRVSLVE